MKITAVLNKTLAGKAELNRLTNVSKVGQQLL
jgi:hypothetical protein